MHRLVVLAGGPRGSVFALADENVTVGRDDDNVIQMDDESVWHHHVVLVRNCDGYILRNLGTRNGTLLNDVPAQEARLKPGDRIRLGRLEVRYESVAEPPTPNPDLLAELTQQNVALTSELAAARLALTDIGATTSRPSETDVALRRLQNAVTTVIARVRQPTQKNRNSRPDCLRQLAGLTEQLIAAQRRFAKRTPPAATAAAAGPAGQAALAHAHAGRNRLAGELAHAREATASLQAELKALQAQVAGLAQANDEMAGKLAQTQADLARARRCFAEHNAAEFQQLRQDLIARQAGRDRRRAAPRSWQRRLCFLNLS